MAEVRSSFIQFVELPPAAKTKRWDVVTYDSLTLGEIKWYAPWRKYCFYPLGGTIYDSNCLANIVEFIDKHKLDRV